ncbi:MAG: hypothetical protein ABIC82_01860 [bacterium]
MKNTKGLIIADIELFLLSLFGLFNVVFFPIINYSARGKINLLPNFLMLYWAMFSFLLVDFYFFKKVKSKIFWKIFFWFGVAAAIQKNISVIPILKTIEYVNILDYLKQIWPLLAIDFATLTFICRNYIFIRANSDTSATSTIINYK